MRRSSKIGFGIVALAGAILTTTALVGQPSASAASEAQEVVMGNGPFEYIACCANASGCAIYGNGCPDGTQPVPCPCQQPQ